MLRITGPDGEVSEIPMADLVASGEKASLARLYAMNLGMNEIAMRQGREAVFSP